MDDKLINVIYRTYVQNGRYAPIKDIARLTRALADRDPALTLMVLKKLETKKYLALIAQMDHGNRLLFSQVHRSILRQAIRMLNSRLDRMFSNCIQVA